MQETFVRIIRSKTGCVITNREGCIRGGKKPYSFWGGFFDSVFTFPLMSLALKEQRKEIIGYRELGGKVVEVPSVWIY